MGVGVLVVLAWAGLHIRAGMERVDSGTLVMPWDQAIYLQFNEHMIRGSPAAAPAHGFSSVLANHFSPVLYLLAPAYACFRLLFGLPDALPVLACLLLALGSLPLISMADPRLRTSSVAVAAASILWIVGPAMNYQFQNGFRETTLSIPVMFLLVWAWERRSRSAFVTGALLLLSIREDYGLLLFGFIFLAARRGWFWRLVPAVGPPFMLFLLWYLMPRVEGYSGTGFDRFGHIAATWQQLALAPFTSPALFFGSLATLHNAELVVALVGAFGFLPVLRPRLVAVGLPYLAMLLLDRGGVTPPASVSLYYISPLLPLLVVSSLQHISRVETIAFDPQRSRWIRFCAVGSVAIGLGWTVWHTSLPGTLSSVPLAIPNVRSEINHLRQSAMISTDMALGTTAGLAPYVADLGGLRLVSPRGSHDSMRLLLPADATNPHQYSEFPLVQDFLRFRARAKHTRPVLWAGKHVTLFGPPTPARAPSIAILATSIRIEAEYTASSDTSNTINRTRAKGSGRRVGGRTLLRRHSKGAPLIGPSLGGGGSVRVLLRIAVADVPASCCRNRSAVLVLAAGASSVSRPLPCPLVGAHDVAVDFPASPQSFSPLIHFRGCGELEVDWLQLEMRR